MLWEKRSLYRIVCWSILQSLCGIFDIRAQAQSCCFREKEVVWKSPYFAGKFARNSEGARGGWGWSWREGAFYIQI